MNNELNINGGENLDKYKVGTFEVSFDIRNRAETTRKTTPLDSSYSNKVTMDL